MGKRKRKITWLLVLIIIIAIFLRTYHITTVPPGLYLDEAMDGNNASEVAHTGHPQVFYTEDNGREGLYVNLVAILLAIFNIHEPWIVRLPAVIAGILTIPGIYLLARELFNEETGLLSAFFLATSFWHINFSRIGFRAILAPLLLVWSIYFLILGFKKLEEKISFRRATLWHLLGGLLFGLGFYTYIAYRVTPLLVLLVFWHYWLRAKKRGAQKEFFHSAAHFIFISILVFLPLGLYFLHNPGTFFGRTSQVSVFNSPAPLRDLALNILKTAAMFNFRGDWNWRHNVSGDPELFWPVGILFLLGIVLALRLLWKRRRSRALSIDAKDELPPFSLVLLFFWFALAALPVVISNEGIPHALRSILMLPPAVMLAAIGGVRLYWWLMEKANHEKLIKICALIFLIIIAVFAYEDYFYVWGRDRDVASAFSENYVAFARKLNALPASVPKYIVVSAAGVAVRGIPAPAQTIMFITDTFLPEEQAAKNIHYVLPQDANKIPPGNLQFEIR